MKFRLLENQNITDNLGNALSPQQIEFFKNSKVRDEQGRLMVCYHGTKNPGFTKFDPKNNKSQFGKYKFGNQNAIYFTASENTARGYTNIGVKENGNIYQCYLNLINPYIVDNSTEADIKTWKNIKDNYIREKEIKKFETEYNYWKSWVDEDTDIEELNEWLHLFNVELRPSDYEDKYGNQYYSLWALENNGMFGAEHEVLPAYTLEEFFEDDMYEEFRDAIIGDYESEEYGRNDYYYDIDTIIRWVLYANSQSRFTHTQPYDGIIVFDILDTGPTGDLFGDNTTDYVVFDARQIKAITNKEPSNSDDINESVETSEANIPFRCVADYKDDGIRELAHKMKEGDIDAISYAAKQMAELIPDQSVLIPIPSHNGNAIATLDLANEIGKLAHLPVIDALKGKSRESSYNLKGQGKILKAEDMGIIQTEDIPEDKLPVFIDNVVTTGNTAKACINAVGRGMVVALASSDQFPRVNGLNRM